MTRMDELREQAIELATKMLREHILESDGEFKSMDITLEFEFRWGKDVNCRTEKRCQGSEYYKPPIDSEMQCEDD